MDITISGNGVDIEQVVRETLRRLSLREPVAQELRTERVCTPEVCVRQLKVRIGVSVRHVHLCQDDVETLFGQGYQLHLYKELYQKGYYAAEEKVMVVGRKSCIENMRVLGPTRPKSQVELAQTDATALGLQLPLAENGTEPGTKPILLVGPEGRVYLPGGAGGGAYIARRHAHLSQLEADTLGLKEGDTADLRTEGQRAITLYGVLVRIRPEWRSEVHLDTDEANACGVKTGDIATLIMR